jgi:hypothetical protein
LTPRLFFITNEVMSSQSVPAFPIRLRAIHLVAVLAAILAAIGIKLMIRATPGLPTVELLPNGIAPYRPPIIHRWIPATPGWGWFWRFKEAVFGRTKTINLDARVIRCHGPETSFPVLAEKEPQFTGTNGLKVWLVGASELEQWRHRLEQETGSELLYQPRFAISDGVQASMYSGGGVWIAGRQQNVGLLSEMLPRIRGQVTDLSALSAFRKP